MVGAMHKVNQSTLARGLNVERSPASQLKSAADANPAMAFKSLSRGLDLYNSSLILGEGAGCKRPERKWREQHEVGMELLGVSWSGKSHGRHRD